MKIEPIISWLNGHEYTGTEFSLAIGYDNLNSYASFNYNISTEEQSHEETVIVTPEIPAWDETLPDGEVIHHDAIPAVTTTIKVVDVYPINLIGGQLNISGEDYIAWDSSVSANEWAYTWAAGQLNLVIVPNQVFV
jgi:hypothetical protein